MARSKITWSLKNYLTVLCSSIWTVDALVGIVRGTGPSPLIAGPMTIILGSIFGHSLLKRGEEDKSEKAEEDRFTFSELERRLKERLEE